MADSIVTFASIGQATSSFSFSFDYLEATDIDAFVEGVSVFANNTSTGTAVGGNTYTVAFSSAGSKTLTFPLPYHKAAQSVLREILTLHLRQ